MTCAATERNSNKQTRRFAALSCLMLFATSMSTVTLAQQAYVSNEDDHSVTVIDTRRGEAVATIPVGKRPRGLKLNEDGSRLYVAVSGLPKCPPSVPDEECEKLERDVKADGIAVVDTQQRKVLSVLPAGSDPEQFAISADGKHLFVANEDTGTVSIVDLAGKQSIVKIAVGREPEGVVLAPNGQWVLITNESDNSVSIIDTKTRVLLRSVVVGKRPRDLALTSDSRHAYVSGEFDASIYRIRIPEGEPVERLIQLRAETRPMAVVLDERTHRLYVSTGRGGSVAVLDVGSDKPKLIREIEVGKRPWGIALSADGRFLYTANGPSNDVSVVDTQAMSVVRKINVGRSPWGVVIGPAAK
jgi:YVTN family beta-propeller protein